MFRFPERQKKEYVECLGPGPHITKNGSRWLVVGLHKYIQIQDGTVRCKSCAERTWRTYPDKAIGYFYLTEQERTQMRTGLAELRSTFEKTQGRTPDKVNEHTGVDNSVKQTKQSKIQ